jgi:hypothetical protein
VILQTIEASHLDDDKVIVADVHLPAEVDSNAGRTSERGKVDAIVNHFDALAWNCLIVNEGLPNRFAHAHNAIASLQEQPIR